MASIKKIALQTNGNQRKILIEAIIDRIKSEFTFCPGAPADFSGVLFVAPTQEAGRIFREELACSFMDSGGVAQLNVMMPDNWFTFDYALPELNEAQTLAAWRNAIDEFDFSQCCSSIFQNAESFKTDLNWSLNFAGLMDKFRRSAALENGTDAAGILALLQSFPEEKTSGNLISATGKISEYLKLEECYLRSKNGLDFADKIIYSVNHAANQLKRFHKIIFMELGEFKKSAEQALNNYSGEAEFYLDLPEEELNWFDDFGRLKAEAGKKLEIKLDLASQLRVFASPVEQAQKISGMIDAESLPSVIGVLDAELGQLLAQILSERKIDCYLPESEKLKNLPLSKLLLQLFDLSENGLSFENCAFLSRNGWFIHLLTEKMPNFDYAKLLKELDKLQSEHLLESFDALKFFGRRPGASSELAVFIDILDDWRRRLAQADSKLMECWTILSEIGSFNPLTEIDLHLAELELEALRQIMGEVRDLTDERIKIPLAKQLINRTGIDLGSDEVNAVDLSGFMELPWRKDLHLLIGGFNEEYFNSQESNEVFLPENLRKFLGFSSAEQRYYADVWRLRELTFNRKLAFTAGKMSLGGDYLQVAKLIFQCDDDELLKRSNLVFFKQLEEEAAVTPAIGGEVRDFPPYMPRSVAVLNSSMSISAFQSYLKCPFNFYLEKVLHGNEINDRKIELDAMQFGTLLHSALDKFGRLAQGQILTVKSIRQIVKSALDEVFQVQFGRFHNSLVDIQKSLMDSSLEYFSEIQAEFSQSDKHDYSIYATELAVNIPDYGAFYQKVFPDEAPEEWRSFITLRGRIDRVDFFRDAQGTPVCQIFDYKSSNKFKTAFDAHCSSTVNESCYDKAPLFAVEKGSKKPFYWQDLQLPLYLLILKHQPPPEVVLPLETQFRGAYFNLPLAASESGISNFDELSDPEVLKRALTAADYVLSAIFVRHKFWPPNRRNNYFSRVSELLHNPDYEKDFKFEGVKNA